MSSLTVLFGVAGLLALAAAIVPKLVADRPFSVPLVMLIAGIVLGLLPLPAPYGNGWGDPAAHLHGVESFTQLGILVALAGAGLSVDRPLGLKRWGSTWRLLALTMPLSILVIAALGYWWLALAPGVALLLAAALAPTDPVLAGDVGVPHPDVEPDLARDNEIRFTLTTEAGLNDGLTMPFVLLGLAVAGSRPNLDVSWVLVDLLLPVAIGVLVGLLAGRGLGWAIFHTASDRLRLAEYGDGLVLLALAFLPYALAELAHGNGFAAVFVAAVVVRKLEREHDYHGVLHAFGHQLERLFVPLALLGLGLAIGDGLLRGLRVLEVVLAVVAVLVVRPVLGWLSLFGSSAGRPATAAIAFFGVRGIGTLYYLAYALNRLPVPQQAVLWRVGALAVAVSVLVHGILAEPAIQRIERMGGHLPST
ncbi:cation:proton antiporter [Amycolatopsis sp. SID8362]|uniref:cation:proton antiporter domain-containing protein n=1 Tax=Amycolatopsis sp. SID8362 TaxID=2690346 RepID=UPI00136CF46A|nr:cation:proton antiporter [Amycolatopsis sp. SID8362]NBH02423.1 sodium:proton antiporter [Amycolatopsis sp. SID8362]NED39127.1 sodium:proton antiporter [Amycolatopsis sp. SID8362]